MKRTAPPAQPRVAVLGLGLMGGSLALALRRTGARVSGFARRAQTRREALRRGVVDEVFATPDAAAAQADLVVVCVPVLAVPKLVAACRRGLRRGAVVTDVGSTKAELAARCAPLCARAGAVFVGSHPMAGSDRAGLAAARADLYAGALVALTPTAATPPTAVARVARLWRRIGARIVRLGPREHDRIIARTSHLPHLAAAALAASVLRGRRERAAEFCGPGFRDATRIAAGSEDLWHDIVKTNCRFVLRELDDFALRLARLRALIQRGDFEALRAFLAAARRRRQRWERRAGGRRWSS